ncbi:MAG: hypothetical protein H0U49_07975 [Parachlamydiaceae bacterium]|nr:hypothetical protein [Parachlamydiaceae bacterium]
MRITSKLFFDKYIIHPFSQELTPLEKTVATIASGIFLLLTFGIIHGRAFWNERNVVKQDPDERITSIVNKSSPSTLTNKTHLDFQNKFPRVLPNYFDYLWILEQELSIKHDSKSNNHVDIRKENSLSQLFENDPHVYFPFEDIEVHQGFENLIGKLSAAFSQGKVLATIKISNKSHCECASFRYNADKHTVDFIIFAGLTDIHTAYADSMQNALNQANIKDKFGNKITFSGKYVDTGLQRGGHHCKRIAELYCYQIAKEKCLGAFKKVNGAFYQQQIESFSDVEKISLANPIDKMPAPTKENPWDQKQYGFFLSWICYKCGIEKNRWEDITLHEILPTLTWTNAESYMLGFPFEKRIVPALCDPLGNFTIEKIKESEKRPINTKAKLGNLFQNKNDILVLKPNGKHFLYQRKVTERIS